MSKYDQSFKDEAIRLALTSTQRIDILLALFELTILSLKRCYRIRQLFQQWLGLFPR
jgi:hypothetical protein